MSQASATLYFGDERNDCRGRGGRIGVKRSLPGVVLIGSTGVVSVALLVKDDDCVFRMSEEGVKTVEIGRWRSGRVAHSGVSDLACLESELGDDI